MHSPTSYATTPNYMRGFPLTDMSRTTCPAELPEVDYPPEVLAAFYAETPLMLRLTSEHIRKNLTVWQTSTRRADATLEDAKGLCGFAHLLVGLLVVVDLCREGSLTTWYVSFRPASQSRTWS